MLHLYCFIAHTCSPEFEDEPKDEPVYERPPSKYSAEGLLKILLDESIPANKICQKRPTHINRSAAYIVDISKLDHPDDVKKDNFGIWSHSGSHTLVVFFPMKKL